jgi:hypothetical protein
MTLQTDNPISRRSALAGLGAGGLGVALAATVRHASAQDATPVSLAGHPLVGAWSVNIPGPPNPPGPALYSFTSDGIVTQLDPVRGNAMGAWVAMGERTGMLTLVFVNYAPGSTTDFQGFAVVRHMLEVDATGDAYVGQSEIEFLAPDGTTRTDGPYGPIPIDGKRIQVETTLVTVTAPATPTT